MRRRDATRLSKKLGRIGPQSAHGLALSLASSQRLQMATHQPGTVAVIFVAQRTPGYRGIDSVRAADGLGITVSYWADDASAKAWRDHPDHAAIRDAGRDRWYSRYDLHVAAVTRSYDWAKS
jgi:heme-degrading monooxygenase HmoA